MNKIFKALVILGILFLVNIPKVSAEEKVIDVYFFYGDGCPHCAKQKEAFKEMKEEYPSMVIHYFEVWKSKSNQKLMGQVADLLDVQVSGVPFTIIGTKTYSGFDEDNTQRLFESRIDYYLENDYVNPVGEFLKGKNYEDITSLIKDEVKMPEDNENYKVKLPIIGSVELKNLSLPLIAITLGALDGFNPCAMWILLFLISMLLGMKDRKRMWALGLTFLITSAIVYAMFMLAWLNFTSVIGSITWLRTLIALIAFVGGGINLRSYLNSRKEDGCDVVSEPKRKKIFESIKKLTHEKSFVIAMVGIIALAASVNIIELACSAGLPVVFTGILTVNDLSQAEYIMYVFLYILVFLVDDIIVFLIAMTTLEVTGISTKYGKMSHLIGGILMIVIGTLMLLKPEWLMFNF